MSIASHELKTPITGIKGLIQVLHRKAGDEGLEFYENMLKKANTQVDKLTKLVNDLLDITRIDSGKLTLNITEFSLEDILNDCLVVLQPDIKTHQIHIRGNNHILVKADKNRLEQVICNILSNALKYSPRGTEILVKVQKNHQWIILSVTDQGPGIAHEKFPLIFDRFYRVHEDDMKAGLGLGLYISREIMERHGGKIELRSEAGQGSTFSIFLPAD